MSSQTPTIYDVFTHGIGPAWSSETDRGEAALVSQDGAWVSKAGLGTYLGTLRIGEKVQVYDHADHSIFELKSQ